MASLVQHLVMFSSQLSESFQQPPGPPSKHAHILAMATAEKNEDIDLEVQVVKPRFDPLKNDYWHQLVQHTKNVQRQEPGLVEFAGLQRMNLLHIQNQLAEIKADISDTKTTSQEQMQLLRKLMHEYGIGHYPQLVSWSGD